MPETFIELIPRSEEGLLLDIGHLENSGIPFDGINLPELRRKKGAYLTPEEMMTMRREGEIAPEKKLALHMRTRERTVEGSLARIESAARHSVDMALLITGDVHSDSKEQIITTDQVLTGMHQIPTDIQIAVGADLYHKNWGRWELKLPAIRQGKVHSIFTQPVFAGEKLDEVSAVTNGLLPKQNVCIGVTWITNSKSRNNFWRDQNLIPENHLPKGETDGELRENCIRQSVEILRAAKQAGFSVYIMMTQGSLEELEGIVNRSENFSEV